MHPNNRKWSLLSAEMTIHIYETKIEYSMSTRETSPINKEQMALELNTGGCTSTVVMGLQNRLLGM